MSVLKTCAQCGKHYSIVLSKLDTSKYCSRKCLGKANAERSRIVSLDSFWNIIDRGPSCWEWPFGKDRDGYGKMRVNGENKRVHRIAYELAIGPIPKNMMVCHHCDNPSCVRPDHLFLGTPKDNAHDMALKGRAIQGEQHHSARISREDVIKIRLDTRPARTIGSDYGISKTAVERIRKRVTWKHV